MEKPFIVKEEIFASSMKDYVDDMLDGKNCFEDIGLGIDYYAREL